MSVPPAKHVLLAGLAICLFAARLTVAQTSSPPTSGQKAIVYNDMGWTSLFRYPASSPMSPDDIIRATVTPLVGTRVTVYQFCGCGGYAANYRSALLADDLPNESVPTDSIERWKALETLQSLKKLNVDPLALIADACRRHGIACQFSLRMGGGDLVDKRYDWFAKHPGALLADGRLDYAHPAAIAYRKAQIAEVLQRPGVTGIDLDFTQFQPSFSAGKNDALRVNLTALVRELRQLTRQAGRTLSARFDCQPDLCAAAGLDVEVMLAEGLFDQISVGSVGDETPDASADWWVERAHAKGCKVYPGLEGRPHAVPCAAGSLPTRPSSDAVARGYGRPSLAYLRASAAVYYAGGADGVTLFNPTCADGPFDPAAYTELADPQALAGKDKQYVASVWPFRAPIYRDFWTSRFKMSPAEKSASMSIRIADDLAAADATSGSPRATLTLDLMGINLVDDVQVLMNGAPLRWNGYEYNHWDHGCWDDVLEFDVPLGALRPGVNRLDMRRMRDNPGFVGNVEARKCILDIKFPGSKPDPDQQSVRQRSKSQDWFTPGRIVQCGPHTPCAETGARNVPATIRLPKMVVYNDDGWSSYMRYPAPQSPEDIVRTVLEPALRTGVTVYQFCSLGGHAVNYNSSFLPRVGEMMDKVDTMHVWRMRHSLRYLESQKTDPLHVMAKACRAHGIALQFSLRMNDAHHTYRRGGGWYFPELQSPWFEAHREALLPNYTLDYAAPVVHAYRKQQIQEILDHYDVSGIDLDFTRFPPWFQNGREKAGMPKMTQLVRDLRQTTKKAGKTLSARFEYDPNACISSGLDLETWLAEGLFDQITLGVTGSHMPDAPIDWWVQRAHKTGCKVCPGMEGQLHWVAASGWGGAGTLPASDGVHDGYGPPTMAYMRAVASVQYQSGADGVSLFNFTCTDGPFARAAFTELADPGAMAFKDKQYDLMVWYRPFQIRPTEDSAAYRFRVSDDVPAAARLGRKPAAVLTLGIAGIADVADVEVRMNDTRLRWKGDCDSRSEGGSCTDLVDFDVPADALRHGENAIELRRIKRHAGFAGDIAVRKCVLEVKYPSSSKSD